MQRCAAVCCGVLELHSLLSQSGVLYLSSLSQLLLNRQPLCNISHYCKRHQYVMFSFSDFSVSIVTIRLIIIWQRLHAHT